MLQATTIYWLASSELLGEIDESGREIAILAARFGGRLPDLF